MKRSGQKTGGKTRHFTGEEEDERPSEESAHSADNAASPGSAALHFMHFWKDKHGAFHLTRQMKKTTFFLLLVAFAFPDSTSLPPTAQKKAGREPKSMENSSVHH